MTGKQIMYSAASLSGLLLGFMSQQLWSDVREHGTAITEIQTNRSNDRELLMEVRADVKELLRLEASKHALSNNP